MVEKIIQFLKEVKIELRKVVAYEEGYHCLYVGGVSTGHYNCGIFRPR